MPKATPLSADSGSSIREQIREAISSQVSNTVTVLSSLLVAQDRLGYLPAEAMDEVAAFTDTTINDVWGVATFYTNFRFSPPGDHVVEVCWGPTCHLEGAAQIIRAVQERLGVVGEGETEDNSVTLKYNTCLGACSQAPVMSIDHRLIGRLTPESAIGLVTDLPGGAAHGAK